MVLSPALAEFLLFQPSRGDPGDPPILAGVDGEPLRLRTSDGVSIQAWWYPASRAEPGADLEGAPSALEPPAVLFLHGNAGDISHRTPIARGLLQEGCSVLLLEYRGYGGSGGSPSEKGLTLDALAGYEFLSGRLGGSRSIVVFGRSMGGAVAARLAATRPTGGLVLESAFTSLEAMARTLYPFLPGILFRRLRGRFDTLSSLREVKVPILVVHGTRDEIVPLRMGRALYEAAGAAGEWFEVSEAGHNDVFWVGGREYFRVVGDFFQKHGRGESQE
ncbi:MAG: alpha/beta hydrolase [Longimicrobiales bacterium]